MKGNQAWAWLRFALRGLGSGGAQGGSRERKGLRPAPALSKEEREAKVARLEVNVADEIEVKSHQRSLFSAVPVDGQGNAIQGLTAEWRTTNRNVIFIKKNGEALAGKPGTATLIATAGNEHATVRVRVVEGTKEPYGGKKRGDSKRSSQAEARGTNAKSKEVVQNRSRREKRAHRVSKPAKFQV